MYLCKEKHKNQAPVDDSTRSGIFHLCFHSLASTLYLSANRVFSGFYSMPKGRTGSNASYFSSVIRLCDSHFR